MTSPTPNLNALSIVVDDMAESLAFYRTCGLDFPEDAAAPHAEATATGGFRILLDTAASVATFDPDWRPATGGQRISLAFECAAPADVDARYEAVTAAGHAGHLAPFDAVWGQRYATVTDPNGNTVDFYAALP
ncbi:VOC family protein [Gordonia rubripertincta]|uniref:VOC family protein n=1 Tax=Gordonia rubripertincta TaxID=36822 RepID=A0ABT4MRQ2_GORRU|nr:VOC family protein [Gordonia rubripertincta]MCZ4548711.1 VOC family protein [Gordonia rubripertincta]